MATLLQISSMADSSQHRLRILTATDPLKLTLSLLLTVMAPPKLLLSLLLIVTAPLKPRLSLTVMTVPSLCLPLTVTAPLTLTPLLITTTPPAQTPPPPSQAPPFPPQASVWTPRWRASYLRSAEILQTSQNQSHPKPSKIPTTMIPLIIRTRLAVSF